MSVGSGGPLMLGRREEPWKILPVRARREEQGYQGSPRRRGRRDPEMLKDDSCHQLKRNSPGQEKAGIVKREKEIQETRGKIQELLWRRADCFPRRHRRLALLQLACSQTDQLLEPSCPPGQTWSPQSLGCS